MKLTITNRINTCNFIANRKGSFRVITKCRAGFMTVSECRDGDNDLYSNHPASVLSGWKKGALQTVEFKADGTDHWLTVFARTGKKIHMVDEEILKTLDVGTINQLWYNTALYSQEQYAAVGAKTWADLAYVRKEDLPEVNQIINQIK
jgi:hypothetical protein